MSKCDECGLEDSHKMSCDTGYDSRWDEERQHLEREVKIAVGNLSDFMGSNSFILPFAKLTVKVTPSNA